MIPSQILRTDSSAERKIFAMLQEVDLGAGAVALHSLNLPRHEYKKWAEADFVILSTFGILLLEVKGGGVSCKNGMWEFTNRYGETSRKRESPAVQARTAFFALRDNYLLPSFQNELWNAPSGWAVVFTDIPNLGLVPTGGTPDQPTDITCFSGDCVGHNTFARFLKAALQYWASTISGKTTFLQPEAIAKMVSHLRPNFEQVPPLARRIEEFREDVTRLTNEQYERLDELQENDRLFIRGGAGTGKTFLAVACARYDQSHGADVLLTTRSEPLVDYLKSAEFPAGIDIAAYNDLPSLLEARGKPWDVLLVDEGQDLCQLDSLDILNSMVSGGLDKGRWRWFGDPNQQISPSFPLDVTALGYLEGLGMKRNLKQNVRNTPKIVETIERYSGATLGAPAALGQGAAARFQELKDGETYPSAVASIVASWTTGDLPVPRSHVAILVHSQDQKQVILDEMKARKIRSESLRPAGSQNRDSVVVGTVEEFKGLERPLICVVGLGDAAELAVLGGRLYRAFSRANHTLAVVLTREETSGLKKLEADVLKRRDNQIQETTWPHAMN
ncbi:NERD domain-containing protein [Tunturiibacter lichenicola]|uniref:nuclease-related domain-containing DEAD/DEAH box helicase n=1 Tax=Tunturiibacter lichenicola TaxID=2051959 RepID=UPI003D9BBE6E